MTETDAVADRSSLVPGAHRLIRAVDGREGPFAGTLVTWDDAVAVCVDVGTLTDWEGWAFSDAEHICGVMDVRRRVDGHDALLPWCTQHVESFLGRRQVAEAQLTAGELGTLVVSLLRGMRELGENAESATGAWWLTGDGRPLFVHGDGGVARAATAALVDRAAQHTTDRATLRVLEEISAALRRVRHHVDDDQRWEQQLLALAAPRALRLDVFAPERVADLARSRIPGVGASVAAHGTRRSMSGARREKVFRRRLGETVAAVDERCREQLRRLRREGTSGSEEEGPKPSRRRPLILAGSLAAVVLVVGLMWPGGGESDGANAEVLVPSTTGPSSTMPPPDEGAATKQDQPAGPDDDADVPAADDPLSVVPVLLEGIRSCIDESADQCPDAVAEGARVPADGIASQGAQASTAALVDDYGDVAVIRLTPMDADATESGEQMLVLEHRNEIWLVRDVYDVAHQPD